MLSESIVTVFHSYLTSVCEAVAFHCSGKENVVKADEIGKIVHLFPLSLSMVLV